jgi:hypothetical protein
MSSLFFRGADRADPMPSENERQGWSVNIFFFHEGSLQGHRLLTDVSGGQGTKGKDCSLIRILNQKS